jgi:hypothetical protein
MRRIAGVLAGAGLVAGTLFAAPASALSTLITDTTALSPYAIVSANATYGTFGVGSTNPGQPDGELCLRVAIASNSSLWLSQTDSGNLMNGGGTVVYQNLDQTLAPIGGTCTLNTTNLTHKGKITHSVSPGTMTITFKADTLVDRGIQSGSSSNYLVTHAPGTTIGITCDLANTCSQTAAGPNATVVTITRNTNIISKSKLDLLQCELEEHDVDPVAGPWAAETAVTGTYVVCAQTAGQNKISGKNTTLTVTGTDNTPVSISFVQSVTSNIQLWDQTLGTCKIGDQDARVILCKGDWGDVVPLNVAVRDKAGVSGGAPYGNPAGINDPDGVTTPANILLGSANL